MSQENGQRSSDLEIACLPAGNPEREKFRASLQAVAGGDPLRWEEQFALTDRLGHALAAPVSPNAKPPLITRLLAIPDAHPLHSGHGGWQRWGFAAAAAILVMIGVGGYIFWPRGAGPASIPHLDPAIAQAIAAAAVQDHERDRTPEIASADPDALAQKLSARGFDFPVMMLKPAGDAKLLGGGSCQLANANAVYTQWQSAGDRYTLFEFSPRDAGAPADFLSTIEYPKNLWHDDFHYRVHIWPGVIPAAAAGTPEAHCCWALVIENQNAPDPFASTAYRAPS